MKVSDKLSDLYRDYYELGSTVAAKREIAARQSVDHLRALLPNTPYACVLDVGAGEGATLAEMARTGFATELAAVEISDTGVAAIEARHLPTLRYARPFDGYHIEESDRAFTLGTAIHVLEHVEHERLFLSEISRVCDLVYVEVPIELNFRTGNAIRRGAPFGHINFYTPTTFRNLLQTSGLDVVTMRLFANSRAYEVFAAGPVKGSVKWAIRSSVLAMTPLAPWVMTYLAGAVCRRSA
ncbi:MAG: SAM-dependent methyltransferase protein [Gemmatimonadetes bacterium]|nr:SAM-dependent methyltransferase protein [Gemmatimonadota bacterium]